MNQLNQRDIPIDLREATAGAPDFVTLNEAVRPPELLALPNYAFHRGTDSRWTLETTVMWRTDRWEALSTGTRYLHQRGGTYGTRAVNWVTLESLETGKVVSVISTHASPVGKGTPDLLPLYMSGLSALVRELAAQGPVFAGGDLNAHYGSGRFPRAGMQAGGLATTYDAHGIPPGGTGDHGGHTIDYLMYQPGAGSARPASGRWSCFPSTTRSWATSTSTGDPGPLTHQDVGFSGVRTQTSKNSSRSWPDASSMTAWKSSVLAVPSW